VSTPDRKWLLVLYGSLLLPIVGPAVLVVASACLCYARRRQPERARWIMRHTWIAIGLNALANVIWVCLMRR
jgi:hypothetical protein